ncbi:hypothetical protein P3L10_030857 [Capsicum annuum]
MGQDEIPVCKGNDIQMYYQSLASCISGTTSQRWVPIHSKSDSLNSTELEIHGIQPDDFFEDSDFWKLALRNYWSLLSPLIFSDHPKRPGDDDPLPPYNMVRNVMDMNAHYGGLSAALMKEGKSVWVMNVVSLGMRNTLPQKYELFRAKLDAAEQRLTRFLMLTSLPHSGIGNFKFLSPTKVIYKMMKSAPIVMRACDEPQKAGLADIVTLQRLDTPSSSY